MMKSKRGSKAPEDLRTRAEESLKSKPDRRGDTHLEEASSLIHELRVHQIELEMQNEELRRVQNDLEISRSRYADLYDFAPVGYLTLNKHGQILGLNLTAARQLGIERGRLANRNFQYFVFQPDKKEFLSHLNAIFDKRERQIAEVRLSLKGGEQFYARIESIYMEGEDGAGLCRTNISDITLRRWAEQASRQLAAIVEGSDDAIISLTLAGIITSWNEAAEILYGYTAAEAIGQPISINVPPEHLHEIPDLLARIDRGERIVHHETIRRKKNGNDINVSLSISPIRDNSGSIIGASTIARDITERERMRKEREKFIAELQEALAKVKALKGLLPICAWCKKIRDDQGYWQQIEAYIRAHSEADFSHGICPECAKKARKENDG
jgi:PAS domain S-box-containing protein